MFGVWRRSADIPVDIPVRSKCAIERMLGHLQAVYLVDHCCGRECPRSGLFAALHFSVASLRFFCKVQMPLPNVMSAQHSHSNFPKLHNAMWPGLVGKGSPGAEPCIDLDAMLDLTANAQVDGIKFDGVDLFLFDPHISINIDDEGIKRLAEKIQAKGF